MPPSSRPRRSARPPRRSRLERQFEFLTVADGLKEVLRQNVTVHSRRRENSAEHSWHLALCALVLLEHADARRLDAFRVVQMLVLHDLVEIHAGDSFVYCDEATADQKKREREAARRLFGLLPRDQARHFRTLWAEFEAMATPEARFARAIDRLQPMLLNLATEGGSWRQHGVRLAAIEDVNGAIALGSRRLWQHAHRLLIEAVRQGHVPA